MRSTNFIQAAGAALLMGMLAVPVARAKLPPLNDDAKAKAAEAAAKAAWSNKVADFQLCKSMDRAAAKYQASLKAAGKEVKPAMDMPACVDPGPYAPVAAAPATVSASAPAAPLAAASTPKP
jgi:hypothetical protein